MGKKKAARYHASTSKLSYNAFRIIRDIQWTECLTSEKYVVTTVRSENFLPASALRARVAASTVSNLT